MLRDKSKRVSIAIMTGDTEVPPTYRISFRPSPFANAVLPAFIESDGNYLCVVTPDYARDLEKEILAILAKTSPELTGKNPQYWLD